MSRLRIFDEGEPRAPRASTEDAGEITRALAEVGVRFERWAAAAPIAPGAEPQAVMDAYRADIGRLSAAHGFQTVDVVSVDPSNPQRDAMRARFLEEHVHREDEVRFFVAGSGLFTLHIGTRVYEVLCAQGDLISVPAETRHWFDMGPAPSFAVIRFFQGPDGWVGHFTGSDIAQRFPRYEPGQAG